MFTLAGLSSVLVFSSSRG